MICWSSSHTKLATVAVPVALLYSAVIPGWFSWALLVRGSITVRELDAQYSCAFGFLYRRFKRKLYWWHLVVMVRQISIIGLQTFLSASASGNQLGIIFGICGGYTLLLFVLRPFIKGEENILDCILQLCLLAITLGAMIRKTNIDEGYPGHVGTALIGNKCNEPCGKPALFSIKNEKCCLQQY